MNVAEKASANLRPNAVDFERFRLRRFTESLGTEELETRDAAVDLAALAGVMEGNWKAVLFRSAARNKPNLSAMSWEAAPGSRRRSASSRTSS